MSLSLRIILICASVLNLIFVLYRIRKSRIQIVDSVFWILFSFILIIFSVIPETAIFLTKLAGMQTPSNFIYLVVIFLLLLKLFLLSMKVSQLELKIKQITQRIALDEYKKDKKIES